MSEAVLTQGTILKRGDGGTPEVFVAVGEVISIAGPDASKAEIDVTTLSSVAKEFKGGLPDFGRVTVELNYVPGNAQHVAMRNDFISASSPTRNWEIHWVNGYKWSFAGYISAFPANAQPDSVIKSSMTVRCSGAVTETAI